MIDFRYHRFLQHLGAKDPICCEQHQPDPKRVWITAANFSNAAHTLIIAYCLTAALSIALAQSILALLLAIWLLPSTKAEKLDKRLLAPIIAWFLVTVLTGVTSLDPGRSIVEAIKGGAFLLIPFAVADSFLRSPLTSLEYMRRVEGYFAALIAGQCLAGLHTIFSDGAGFSLPSILSVPGQMTESGQLVLIIPLLIASGVFAINHSGLRDNLQISLFGYHIPPTLYSGTLAFLLLFISWPGEILGTDAANVTLLPRILALAAALLLVIPPLKRGVPLVQEKLLGGATFGGELYGPRKELFQLLWPAATLLVTALLINLKRGPWLGVFAEFILLGFLLSRRLLFWAVVVSFAAVLTLSPARARLSELDEHFNIAGGRRMMWSLGEELLQRYPMGIGLNNARYIRVLDPSIPFEHRHLHNNLLNVTVETGWLGLAAYLWWITHICWTGIAAWSCSLSSKDRLVKQFGYLTLFLSVGLIGWQLAGLVEYNFGDGEIRLIAFLYMGLIAALSQRINNSQAVAKEDGQ